MNKFIVADSANCIGCHACEVACVTSHRQDSWPQQRSDFLPRIRVFFNRKASSATTCRHCNDAPCVGSCPTQALSVANDSVQFTEALCIGCKNCVIACPFGAIEMVANDDDAPQLAQKCDLCRQHPSGQQACVASCPTQALRLMDEAAVNQLRTARQIRSALERPLEGVRGARRNAILNKPPRVGAKKVPADDRLRHFGEIYQPLSERDAEYESERCLYCAQKAWCNWTCPLHNHIPDFIRLVNEGKIIEAAELCHQSSSLPEICGRVCPQDRLCEGACTLKNEGGSVAIGNLERYITDTALAMGWRPTIDNVAPRPERVAVIGAGPAGLGCADILVRAGVHVDVFDRHPEIGGLLTFGIPAFKLDKSLLARRREIFTQMGVRFELNCEIGKDIPLTTLLDDYDAVFIGAGTYRSMKADLPNEDAPGVYDALPFLIANTKQVMGLLELPEEPYVNTEGLNVVVLGGGDTAMDCVRTALRHGAKQVTCAYRRDEANMPGSKKEVKNAREEGAQFEFNVQPVTLELNEEGHVNGVRFLRTRLGTPDAQGRRSPSPIPGSEFVMPADAVIMAFGFHPHGMPWLESVGVKLDSRGRIKANVESRYRYQTTHRKVFAGGDAVRGADLVVTAMAEGRHAAQGIMDFLGVKSIPLH